MESNLDQKPPQVTQTVTENNPVSSVISPKPADTPEPKSRKFGWIMVAMLALLWVVLLLVYIFIPGKGKSTDKLVSPLKQEQVSESSLSPEPTLSESDNPNPENLVSDLENTKVTNLDSELGDIEKELATP